MRRLSHWADRESKSIKVNRASMQMKELLLSAEREARRAFGAEKDPNIVLRQQGSVLEWDEGACIEIFEVTYEAMKTVSLIDFELDAETCEILSWFDTVKTQDPQTGTLTDGEAIQIATAAVPAKLRYAAPEVRHVVEDERPLVSVLWVIGKGLVAGESKALEVLVHPGIRAVCGCRRISLFGAAW